MSLPVTLRVPAIGARTLAKDFGARGVPALALEEAVPGAGYPADTLDVASCGAPILAVWVPRPASAGGAGSVAHGGKEVRDAAYQSIGSSLAMLKTLRCTRLVIPVGAVFANAHAVASRDEVALNICRRLHTTMLANSELQVLLMPCDGTSSFLDPETFGWIRGELPRVGLALDYGETKAFELQGGPSFDRWMADYDAALGFVCVSDHDGAGRVVLPGCGVGDFGRLRDALGRSRPRVVRPPVGVTFADIVTSAEEADLRFGLAGDVDSWRA